MSYECRLKFGRKTKVLHYNCTLHRHRVLYGGGDKELEEETG